MALTKVDIKQILLENNKNLVTKADLVENNKNLVTKADLVENNKNLVTKADLVENNKKLVTHDQLTENNNILLASVEGVITERLEKFRTEIVDELQKTEDAMISEIKASREERTIQSHQIVRNTKRIEKLEKKVFDVSGT